MEVTLYGKQYRGNMKKTIISVFIVISVVLASQVLAFWTPYDHINLKSFYQIIGSKNISVGIENGSALLTVGGNVTPASKLALNVTGNLYVNMTTGSVGINQSDPSSLLDIQGTAEINGILDMQNNDIIDVDDIGQTTDEIGNIYISENKSLYIGNTQQSYITYDGTKMTIKVN